jgi:hypothetical protein
MQAAGTLGKKMTIKYEFFTEKERIYTSKRTIPLQAG